MRVTWVGSGPKRYYYLSNSVRDGKKVKTIHIKKIGRLDELGYLNHEEAINDLRKKYKDYSDSSSLSSSLIPITININKSLDINSSKNTSSNVLNIGYLYLDKIYNELNLGELFKTIKKENTKLEYDLDQVVRLLIFSRILNPSSKAKTHSNMSTLFNFKDIDLNHVYRSLDILFSNKDKIEETIYKNSSNLTERDTSVLYYDCTNFFFEREMEDLDIVIDEGKIDGLRKYGKSKENRPNPIVQMGLFMDRSGIPLGFNIFPGNTNEQITTIPLEKRIVKDFKLSKFIYCSDAGLGSIDTRLYNSFLDRSYIITKSLKKITDQAKDIIFNDSSWFNKYSKELSIDEFKSIKEDKNNKEVYYKVLDYYEDVNLGIKINGKKTKPLKQKLIVAYSNKYKEYQETIRNNRIERAKKLIQNGSFDKENINSPKNYIVKDYITIGGEKAEYKSPRLDYDKIDEESKYDGYYAVITNISDSPLEVVKINENRWEIEESFRILKTNFKSRPVYVYKKEHINAHFLICFIALVIFRILEKELENKYTVDEIIDNLKNINVLPFKDNLVFKSTYNYSEFIDILDKRLDIRLNKEAFYINELKNILKKKKKL